MAKSYKNIKLESEGEPKHFYTTKKPARGLGASKKLRLRKYNPRAMEHQWYKEVRLK
jgi:ribosomal protein L33